MGASGTGRRGCVVFSCLFALSGGQQVGTAVVTATYSSLFVVCESDMVCARIPLDAFCSSHEGCLFILVYIYILLYSSRHYHRYRQQVVWVSFLGFGLSLFLLASRGWPAKGSSNPPACCLSPPASRRDLIYVQFFFFCVLGDKADRGIRCDVPTHS